MQNMNITIFHFLVAHMLFRSSLHTQAFFTDYDTCLSLFCLFSCKFSFRSHDVNTIFLRSKNDTSGHILFIDPGY
jgi:hypothetical protein